MTFLSYNIHKGRAYFSRRKSWHIIQHLLQTFTPDLVFLQEFFREPDAEKLLEQAAAQLWPHHSYGQNAVSGPYHFGNAILSKHPILNSENLNISTNNLEKRGLLYAIIEVPVFGKIHAACTHLNLTAKGRREQIKKIQDFLATKVSASERLIFAGDFNDWNMRLHPHIIESLGVHEALWDFTKRPVPTYPSVFPLFPLDRLYLRNMKAKEGRRIIDPRLMFQSDHLPIWASLQSD